MSGSFRFSLDRVVFAAAAALGLGGAVWTWQARPRLDALRRESAAAPLTGRPYERVALPEPAAVAQSWPAPRAQSSGPGWVYEVFTPPVIYYHADAKSFAVAPPRQRAEAPLVFGAELLQVQRELYRLQLVGFVGAPGDYVAAFTSPQLPETLLARSGRRFTELGLTLASLDVRKVDVSKNPTMPAYEFVAFATLRDERSGELVTLDSRERKFTDTPLALLRLGAEPKPRHFREGESFRVDDITYRVERIQLDPPEVVVAKHVEGLSSPETRVLQPSAPSRVAKQSPAPADRFLSAVGRGVAASEPSH